jgi:dTDP-glucose pyrophosphorylase
MDEKNLLKVNSRIISNKKSMLDALKQMDLVGCKLLMCVDEGTFTGLVSVGDIQRAIIRNEPLSTPLLKIIRKNNLVASQEDSIETIKSIMMQHRMEFLPVISENKSLDNVYFWEDIFESKSPVPNKKFNLPVVIMAGGIGSRLKPLTNVLPKPLIPVGEKSMLEEIFDRFNRFGCDHFYLSLNYKADLIEYYIKSQDYPYHFHFFRENKPLGTGGSMYLIKHEIKSTFFVTNCDILIDQDYSEILDFHMENKNEITVVAALKHYPLPYGIIETGENGLLVDIREKPELTLKINSGMYILEPQLLDDIPEDSFFHITQLVDIVMARNGKVGVFPVSEKSWKDFGLLEDYLNLAKGK